jgi:iron complex transport system substrate-binding protein
LKKILSFIVFFVTLACNYHCAREHKTSSQPSIPQRIISFAPSITETLFALSLGERIIAVTDYCTYPAATKELPKVGGYINPNFEMILRQKPDLVLLLKEHASLFPFLNANGIRYLTIDNHDVAGITGSFRLIAEACGIKNRGDSLADHILTTLQKNKAVTITPKVLLVVGRDNVGSGTISKVYVAGQKTFYLELLAFIGASNAYESDIGSYPALSVEALLRINPDIIIDLAVTYSNISPEKASDDWLGLQSIQAVKTRNVYCPSQGFLTIPGPRIDSTFQVFAQIIDRYVSVRERY